MRNLKAFLSHILRAETKPLVEIQLIKTNLIFRKKENPFNNSTLILKVKAREDIPHLLSSHLLNLQISTSDNKSWMI
jgi:hypothetical protein